MTFRKTRNRIMLLNMAMVSAAVVIAFAVIFVATYTREQEIIRAQLEHSPLSRITISGVVSDNGVAGEMVRFDTWRVDNIGIPVPAPPSASTPHLQAYTTISTPVLERRILPGTGVAFSVLTDEDYNIVSVHSAVELPETAYSQAISGIVRNGSQGSMIMLEGRMWRYAVSPVPAAVMGTTAYTFDMLPGAYRNVRFLDVTDSHNMLMSLALTLSGLTVIIMVVFFFISLFFANHAIKPMEESFKKQSRFVADASHELKTPLSVISANCSVLYASREESVESQIKWVDNITSATNRMTGLVGDLLSLAQIEDREYGSQTIAFDLSGAVECAVSEMESAAQKKEINITKHIAPNLNIESDLESTLKILVILLDNAIKYTNIGGEISVSLKKEKRQMICAVRNSGNGIPQEELPLLFDRFYRGDPARSSENEGYGLGLSIAKEIAGQLNIQLQVISEPGIFTEFRIVFNLK